MQRLSHCSGGSWFLLMVPGLPDHPRGLLVVPGACCWLLGSTGGSWRLLVFPQDTQDLLMVPRFLLVVSCGILVVPAASQWFPALTAMFRLYR